MFDKKLDDAGTNNTKIKEANEWYDEQENLTFEKVAKEFKVTPKQAKGIYLKVSSAESGKIEEIVEKKGKSLSLEEIEKLIEEQGSLE